MGQRAEVEKTVGKGEEWAKWIHGSETEFGLQRGRPFSSYRDGVLRESERLVDG